MHFLEPKLREYVKWTLTSDVTSHHWRDKMRLPVTQAMTHNNRYRCASILSHRQGCMCTVRRNLWHFVRLVAKNPTDTCRVWRCRIVSRLSFPPENPLFSQWLPHSNTQKKSHTNAHSHSARSEPAGERGAPLWTSGGSKDATSETTKVAFTPVTAPFNHLPLQTGGSDAGGLPAAFAPAALDTLPYRRAKRNRTCAGIKLNCVFHKMRANRSIF